MLRPFCFRAASVVVAACALLAAPSSSAQDMRDLIGNRPKPLLDGAGYFSVLVPSGFDCQAEPRKVRCRGNRGPDALLTIDVIDVPLSASTELVLLNQMEHFQKKPHFRLIHKKRVPIDGGNGMVATFGYDHFGNVEYQVGVQQLIVVKSGKEFLLHYEGRLDQFAVYKRDLEQLYASFKTARIDAGGNPIIEDLRPRGSKNDGASPDVNRALNSGF